MAEWRVVKDQLPEEDTEVMTKIDNEDGCRNEVSLVYMRNLWWFPDMSMYVYYTPTHWAPIEGGKDE